MLKDTDKLTVEDRIQLEGLFRISEPLRKAYKLKQQFEYVKASETREKAAKRLSKWILDAQSSKLIDFMKVSLTYQNWNREILIALLICNMLRFRSTSFHTNATKPPFRKKKSIMKI